MVTISFVVDEHVDTVAVYGNAHDPGPNTLISDAGVLKNKLKYLFVKKHACFHSLLNKLHFITMQIFFIQFLFIFSTERKLEILLKCTNVG